MADWPQLFGAPYFPSTLDALNKSANDSVAFDPIINAAQAPQSIGLMGAPIFPQRAGYKLTPAPEGGVYEPDQIRDNEKYFKAVDPKGNVGAEVLVRFKGDKTASIEDILNPELPREMGRGAIGTADMIDLLRQFRQMHPDIERITGKRVSGASMGGGYDPFSPENARFVDVPLRNK